MMLGAAGMVAALAAAPAGAATAITPTGSGTVDFRFLSFRGPMNAVFPNGDLLGPDTQISFNSMTVGLTPTGDTQPTGPGSSVRWVEGETIIGAGANVSEIGFTGDGLPPTSPAYNRIKFTPAPFTNVAPGQDFTLGTFEFQNGSWGGGGFDPGGAIIAATMPTFMPFRITTSSSNGPQFNQTQWGVVVHRVIGTPTGADLANPLVQNALADYITVYMEGENGFIDFSTNGVGSFRVYDLGQSPAGFSNVGSVTLQGKFGSLLFTGLTDPQGGFVTQSAGILPTTPGGGGGVGVIPEPSTWMLMILGFGLIAQQLRRRHLAAA
jgi:hypothetical protein